METAEERRKRLARERKQRQRHPEMKVAPEEMKEESIAPVEEKHQEVPVPEAPEEERISLRLEITALKNANQALETENLALKEVNELEKSTQQHPELQSAETSNSEEPTLEELSEPLREAKLQMNELSERFNRIQLQQSILRYREFNSTGICPAEAEEQEKQLALTDLAEKQEAMENRLYILEASR